MVLHRENRRICFMTTEGKWLITVASWEQRFLLGTQKLLTEHQLSDVLMFHYEEYKDWTRVNKERALKLFEEHNIHCEQVSVSFADPVGAWRTLRDRILPRKVRSQALVDCTTMPRDMIWTSFELLRRQDIATHYTYHQPESYDPEWLSRDPGRPRLVYKLSGIATLGYPICLVITTGFDPERTRQLMWYYEPRLILLGFQSGAQFDNQNQNVARHEDALREEHSEFDIRKFFVDAYSGDYGESKLATHIKPLRGSHNIVMTSLGPKLGAVALFRLHSKHPETALAYAPSRQFNQEYSKGIAESYSGVIEA